ncbi:hypothetical protein SteCoe_3391 [Stentor coeruleus]|uniref:RRM domain-containing protein n=1 Tax=Stentor coeruleus TaxID=5963 RepID=A0A1R2CX18_9CILI|nr:hypothetical protein SteCoe_3391 [Stentor coeruleus]
MLTCLIRRGLKLKQLLVRNLDANVKPYNIREVFGKIGTIKEFDMPYDPETSHNKGYAFIEYSDPKNCDEAIKHFHNQKIFTNYVKLLIIQDDQEGAIFDEYKFSKRTEYVNHSYNKEKIKESWENNFT